MKEEHLTLQEEFPSPILTPVKGLGMRLGSPSTSRLKQLTVYVPVVLLTGCLLKHFETRSRSLIAWSLDRPLPKFLIAWFTVIQREKKIIVLPWRLQSINFCRSEVTLILWLPEILIAWFNFDSVRKHFYRRRVMTPWFSEKSMGHTTRTNLVHGPLLAQKKKKIVSILG